MNTNSEYIQVQITTADILEQTFESLHEVVRFFGGEIEEVGSGWGYIEFRIWKANAKVDINEMKDC